MYSVHWSARAEVDVHVALDLLELESPQAAFALADAIDEVVKKLEQFPALYRRGLIADTREAIIRRKFVLTYRIAGAVVEIIAFEPCRRRRQVPKAR